MTDDILDRLERAREAGLISDQECVSLAMAAQGVRKGSGAPGSNVHEWRRGESAEAGDLQPGDSIATFLDRQGRTSDRYAGGGSGTPGAGLDHAAVFQRYVYENGQRVGMEVAEQYAGSGGVHERTYRFNSGFGERNGSNYFKISGLGGSSTANPTASSGQFLVEEQQRRERAREEAIRETGTGPSERNPAIAARGHFAHLHEIHDHISQLHARVADLEARIERKMRKGLVTDVDATKHLARMEIGRDCDGSNQSGGLAGPQHSFPADCRRTGCHAEPRRQPRLYARPHRSPRLVFAEPIAQH